ncbi:MAG: hypothetical protein ACTSR1_12520 [Candidatus Heimdallarchaeota archaeon]
MSEFNPDLELQRIVFDFEEKPIMIKCLADNAGIKVGEGEIKLIKGSEFEVPFWIARILSEQNLAEQTPIELDHDFYPVVSLQIEALSKKEGMYSLRDRERMEALLKDIISKRRFKIIKLSQKSGDPSPFIRHLTPEEGNIFDGLW